MTFLLQNNKITAVASKLDGSAVIRCLVQLHCETLHPTPS